MDEELNLRVLKFKYYCLLEDRLISILSSTFPNTFNSEKIKELKYDLNSHYKSIINPDLLINYEYNFQKYMSLEKIHNNIINYNKKELKKDNIKHRIMNHKDIKFIKQDNYRENKRDFMEALFKMLDTSYFTNNIKIPYLSDCSLIDCQTPSHPCSKLEHFRDRCKTLKIKSLILKEIHETYVNIDKLIDLRDNESEEFNSSALEEEYEKLRHLVIAHKYNFSTCSLETCANTKHPCNRKEAKLLCTELKKKDMQKGGVKFDVRQIEKKHSVLTNIENKNKLKGIENGSGSGKKNNDLEYQFNNNPKYQFNFSSCLDLSQDECKEKIPFCSWDNMSCSENIKTGSIDQRFDKNLDLIFEDIMENSYKSDPPKDYTCEDRVKELENKIDFYIDRWYDSIIHSNNLVNSVSMLKKFIKKNNSVSKEVLKLNENLILFLCDYGVDLRSLLIDKEKIKMMNAKYKVNNFLNELNDNNILSFLNDKHTEKTLNLDDMKYINEMELYENMIHDKIQQIQKIYNIFDSYSIN